MLTIMAHLKVKAAVLDEYLQLVARLTRETQGKREGCISYAFNQRVDEPTEFVLYEQWQSQAHLNAHIEYLKQWLGPAKEGALLPEKLMNMYEAGTSHFYRVIE